MSATMSRELFTALEEMGYDVRGHYSGKFMYGKECFAYVTNSLPNSVLELYQAMRTLQEEDICVPEICALWDSGIFSTPSCDALGLQSIIYYPELQVEGVSNCAVHDGLE